MGSTLFLVRFPKKYGEQINIGLSYLVVFTTGLLLGIALTYHSSKTIRLNRDIKEYAEKAYNDAVQRHIEKEKAEELANR